MWRPSIKQLEVIADMGNARLSHQTIPATLGIAPEVFATWLNRTAAAVEPKREPAVIPKMPEPLRPRIAAERIFQNASR